MASEQMTEKDEVIAAARFLLRRASKPTADSSTAQVSAAALDRLRTAVADLDALSLPPADQSGDNRG